MEINEEKLKKVLEEQRKEYQRHLDVVAEDFKSQIKILAKTTGGIQEQLIAIREMVAKNTEDIEIIKMDIQFIKQELKHKVDRDEFEALEKRVLILEKKLRRA
jgi:ribosomal protein S9